MGAENGWNWPPSMDAVVAAPESHRVLLEDDTVRVLDETIAAGHREPEHAHREPSVMIVDGPARIRYHQGGALTFASPADTAAAGTLSWMDPEGPHSVETSIPIRTTQYGSSYERVAAHGCRNDEAAS
jgi:hypothetical protein